ncbi:MAG: DNA-directed RNA polymerase subunit K [Desulfurococcaceae archaeon]|nr:DNA-directed RNA polymerase subunit K [Desulfurococcaceae archaeon]
MNEVKESSVWSVRDVYKSVIKSKLTRFELARVIGARALQLALGAPPLINVDNLPVKDPVYIAIVELLNSQLPMSIQRPVEGGGYELIPVSKLITPETRRYLSSLLESWNISSRV